MSSRKENESLDGGVFRASSSMSQISVFSKPVAPSRRTASTTPGRVASQRKPLQRLPGSFENNSPHSPSGERLDHILESRRRTPSQVEKVKIVTTEHDTRDDWNDGESEIRRLTAENKRLERANGNHENEITILRDQVTELEVAGADKEKLVADHQREHTQKQKKLNEALAEKVALEAHCEQLQAEIDLREQKIANLHEQHRQSTQVLREREVELREVNNQLDQAEDGKTKAQREYFSVSVKLDGLQKLLSENQDALQQSQSALAAARSENAALIEKLRRCEKELEAVSAPDGPLAQNELLRNKIVEARNASADSTEYANELKHELDRVTRDYNESTKLHEDTSRQRQEAIADLHDSRSRLQERDRELADTNEQLEKLRLELRASECALEEARGPGGPADQLRALRMIQCQDKQNLEDALLSAECLRNEKQILEKQIFFTEKKQLSQQRQIEELQAEAANLEESIQAKESEVKAFRAERDQLRQLVQHLNDELGRLQGPGGVVDSYARLRDDHEDLQASYRVLEEGRDRSMKRSEQLDEEITRVNMDNSALQLQVKDHSAALSTLREKSQKHIDMLEESREQVARLKSDILVQQQSLCTLQESHDRHANSSDSLRSNLLRAQEKVELLEGKNRGLEETVLRLDNELLSLQEKELDSSKRSQALEALLKSAEAESQTSQARLTAYEIEVERLTCAQATANEQIQSLRESVRLVAVENSALIASRKDLTVRHDASQAAIADLLREREDDCRQSPTKAIHGQSGDATIGKLRRSNLIGRSTRSMKSLKSARREHGPSNEFCRMPEPEALSGVMTKKCRGILGGTRERFFWITPYQPFLFWSQEHGKGAIRRVTVKEVWHDSNEIHVLGDREVNFSANSEEEAKRWTEELKKASRHREIPHPGGKFSAGKHPERQPQQLLEWPQSPVRYSSRSLA